MLALFWDDISFIAPSDSTVAPYAYSNIAGFAQHLDAESQVASLTNTQSSSQTSAWRIVNHRVCV